jgi:hypothetical protein
MVARPTRTIAIGFVEAVDEVQTARAAAAPFHGAALNLMGARDSVAP